YGMDPNQFIQQISSNGQIGNLFSDVRRGKALAAAICRVEAKDDEGNAVDVEQYFGEEDTNEANAEENTNDEA
ncbi:MAG: trigger factor, partial [Corynebacterium casei]|nr:trigger factor [Corynebacterium casei]